MKHKYANELIFYICNDCNAISFSSYEDELFFDLGNVCDICNGTNVSKYYSTRED